MTFVEDYQAAVHAALKQHPHWRIGQAHFNVLSDMRPDLAELVRGSALDPFHNDGRVPALLGMVAVSHSARAGKCGQCAKQERLDRG